MPIAHEPSPWRPQPRIASASAMDAIRHLIEAIVLTPGAKSWLSSCAASWRRSCSSALAPGTKTKSPAFLPGSILIK